MSGVVLTERRSAVVVVTLNLPRKRNALGAELYPELTRVLETLQGDGSLRAIVLTGGPHFSVGGDLEGLDAPVLEMRRAMHLGQRLIRAIVGGPLPVVAAVEGNAYGAGFSLAMACDFVVADANTRFCAAFGRVGLTPDYGLLWTLPQRVGTVRTRELVMLCEPIDGTQAHAWGAVDRLCESGTVLPTAIALAERLARQPTGTISTTKAVLSRLPLNLDTLLAWEADTQALLVQSDDFREGVRAFTEKRPPSFENSTFPTDC
jgi:2-(1,2-epoxy-1,2-dihydrophenyl)acetyl-CoA isomerase